MNSKRVPAKIVTTTSIIEDQRLGYRQFYVMLNANYGDPGQNVSFGFHQHSDESAEKMRDFQACLCATFGVTSVAELVGKECNLLYWFPPGNQRHPVDGLESLETGKRFMYATWMRKWSPSDKTALEQRRDQLSRDIDFYQHSAAEAALALANLEDDFTNWDNEPAAGGEPCRT